ncbi:MAG: hypothetical protein ACLPLZ_03195 [Terracidiphilus sp.]
MSDVAATNPLIDLFHRLRLSLAWVAAQFWVTLLLILAGAAWTRLPDSYAWQVGLSLFVPLVLLAAALLLQAGTMRKLFHDEQRRVHLALGVLTLLVWAAIVWAAWALLDWCSDQIPVWAGYLNSRASAHMRATLLTYDHIQTWLTFLVWIFRWIAVPAKVIPWAMSSAQSGWRLPWRKIIRLLFNWRWWLAVIIAALVAVEWPSHFFNGEPQGTVSHQVWSVTLKLAGAYLLAIISWVLLLAWCAVLLCRHRPSKAQPSDDSLVAVPVGSAPLGEDSVKLPLPQGDDNSGGNA